MPKDREAYMAKLRQRLANGGTRTKSGCLIWNKACVNGYGQINVTLESGRPAGVLVHRVAYHLYVDPSLPILREMGQRTDLVKNTCMNNRCYEPTHLIRIAVAKR